MQNPSFRSLPFMGVIRVNEEAGRLGFTHDDPEWVNLGQGQPEVGELAGAPPSRRLTPRTGPGRRPSCVAGPRWCARPPQTPLPGK